MAKRIIKLINATAAVVNGDPDVRDRLKVVFFPDFNVKNAQPIYPAADLSASRFRRPARRPPAPAT